MMASRRWGNGGRTPSRRANHPRTAPTECVSDESDATGVTRAEYRSPKKQGTQRDPSKAVVWMTPTLPSERGKLFWHPTRRLIIVIRVVFDTEQTFAELRIGCFLTTPPDTPKLGTIPATRGKR